MIVFIQMLFNSGIIFYIYPWSITISIMSSNQIFFYFLCFISSNVSTSQYRFDDFLRSRIFLDKCILSLFINDKSIVVAGFYSVVNGFMKCSEFLWHDQNPFF